MSQLLECLRTRQPLPKPVGLATTEHRTEEGTCRVTLGPLPVLASYSVDAEGDVEVVCISIQGYEIGAECFDGEQCAEWAKAIKADRAEDKRMAREAAADDLWLSREAA